MDLPIHGMKNVRLTLQLESICSFQLWSLKSSLSFSLTLQVWNSLVTVYGVEALVDVQYSISLPTCRNARPEYDLQPRQWPKWQHVGKSKLTDPQAKYLSQRFTVGTLKRYPGAKKYCWISWTHGVLPFNLPKKLELNHCLISSSTTEMVAMVFMPLVLHINNCHRNITPISLDFYGTFYQKRVKMVEEI